MVPSCRAPLLPAPSCGPLVPRPYMSRKTPLSISTFTLCCLLAFYDTGTGSYPTTNVVVRVQSDRTEVTGRYLKVTPFGTDAIGDCGPPRTARLNFPSCWQDQVSAVSLVVGTGPGPSSQPVTRESTTRVQQAWHG